MDFTEKRRNALLHAYRSEQLQIDGLISCGSLLGLTDGELVWLLEDAAEGEPAGSRNGKLALLLLRGARRGRRR